MKPVYRARKKIWTSGQFMTGRYYWGEWVWIDKPETQGRFYDQVQSWCYYKEKYTDVSVLARCKT